MEEIDESVVEDAIRARGYYGQMGTVSYKSIVGLPSMHTTILLRPISIQL